MVEEICIHTYLSLSIYIYTYISFMYVKCIYLCNMTKYICISTYNVGL